MNSACCSFSRSQFPTNEVVCSLPSKIDFWCLSSSPFLVEFLCPKKISRAPGLHKVLYATLFSMIALQPTYGKYNHFLILQFKSACSNLSCICGPNMLTMRISGSYWRSREYFSSMVIRQMNGFSLSFRIKHSTLKCWSLIKPQNNY